MQMSSLLEVAPNNSSNVRASTLHIFPLIIEDHLRGFPRILAKLPPTHVRGAPFIINIIMRGAIRIIRRAPSNIRGNYQKSSIQN